MNHSSTSYFALFNGITDALDAMEQNNYGIARDILIKAQQEAEELWLCAEDDEAEELWICVDEEEAE